MKKIESNEKYYRENDIVMLPTNVSNRYNCTQGLIVKCHKAWTPIGEDTIKENTLGISKNYSTGVLEYYTPQYLYVLSNGKIIEDDWCYDKVMGLIFKTDNDTDFNYINQTDVVKKIICTNNKEIFSITLGKYQELLPQIPQSFINEYINEYNKGNYITKVLVEMLTTNKIYSNLINEVNILNKIDDWLNIQQHGNTLKYWKNNAEENYLTTPISVLKYITCLEKALSEKK